MESPKPGKTQDMYSPHTINEDKELSYEEEQLQLIIMKQIEEKRIKKERKLIKQQNEEYNKSVKVDIHKENVLVKEKVQFEEISIEEMRKIRVARFCN